MGLSIEPRPYLTGALAATFAQYPQIGPVQPAMGYGPAQIADLAATIAAVAADLVLVATPIDLRRVITLTGPAQRVRYELQEIGEPTLTTILRQFWRSEASDRVRTAHKNQDSGRILVFVRGSGHSLVRGLNERVDRVIKFWYKVNVAGDDKQGVVIDVAIPKRSAPFVQIQRYTSCYLMTHS